jgi:integrase
MNKCSSLTDQQRHNIRDAIKNSVTLAEITQETNVTKVIEYLLEDRSKLERYLSAMAAVLTRQRRQISHSALILSIFHYERSKLSLYDKDFLTLLTSVVEREREIQRNVFIAENHLQADIGSDVWKMYEWHGNILRLKMIDFTKVRCPPLRYEMKHYLRYLFENTGKVNVPLFCCQYMAINALTEVNPRIRYFADVTEADARALLVSLEHARKENGDPLSQYYIAKSMNSVKRAIDYLMSDMRDSAIKAPQPYRNPFANFAFHNLREYNASTSPISENVIEQINCHSKDLPPLYKLLYDIFASTGLRLKEVFFLEADCVEPSRYDGICQLKFKPHKVITARRRHGAGDYHRIMIPQELANKISCHIAATAPMRQANDSPYIFLSQRLGYSAAVMDSLPFIKSVRGIIEKYDICGEDGELWHFTSRQFRKTIAVTLIENGATTAELAYWLGHMCSDTAAKYYAEVRKMKLAELNTRFFRERFDLILSSKQLEEYTEEERKLLYIDFRLEQRRVELGFCLVKAADGPCQNRSSLYNCVNCRNLCTGKKYLPYWSKLLVQQEAVVEKLIDCYHTGGILNYTDFSEYKQEFRLLKGYESIVKAINEGGGLHD